MFVYVWQRRRQLIKQTFSETVRRDLGWGIRRDPSGESARAGLGASMSGDRRTIVTSASYRVRLIFRNVDDAREMTAVSHIRDGGTACVRLDSLTSAANRGAPIPSPGCSGPPIAWNSCAPVAKPINSSSGLLAVAMEYLTVVPRCATRKGRRP